MTFSRLGPTPSARSFTSGNACRLFQVLDRSTMLCIADVRALPSNQCFTVLGIALMSCKAIRLAKFL